MTVKQVPAHIAALISKDLPVPANVSGRKPGAGKYEPVAWLGVGESFFVPGAGLKLGGCKNGCYSILQRRQLTASLAVREEVLNGVAGFRVWRTK